MYQGLGQTYINVFFWLTAICFVAAVVTVLVVRRFKQISTIWCALATILLGSIFAYAVNTRFHHRMFARQHQKYNTVVPQTGCLSYEPSFGHLFATYRMSRTEFDDWVSGHPGQLKPYDQAFVEHDGKRLGFTDPELAFATEMASNGGQLRAYFKEGTMYLSYNVM